MAIILRCPVCDSIQWDYSTWSNWPKEPKKSKIYCVKCSHSAESDSLVNAKKKYKILL